MSDTFELRRQSDDLVYTFTRKPRADGLPGFQRTDRDLWIVFKPDFGWISWDEASLSVTGRPWDVLPRDRIRPRTVLRRASGVSRKDSKSYVYQLVHIKE